MPLTTYTDLILYYEAVEAYLLRREAEHGLAFGRLNSRIAAPERLTGKEFFATLEADGEVIGAVLCTPPHNTLITHIAAADPAPFLAEAAQALHERYGQLAGTTGTRPFALGLAAAWEALTGRGYVIEMEQGLYKANHITLPEGVPGGWRFAGQADLPLLKLWLAGFHSDAFAEAPNPDRITEMAADYAVRSPDRGTFIWEVGGEPVAMANYRGPTPHGIRVVGVYTPPEHRGNGYGTAVTAAISAYNLGELGREFCMLYTDLANPTSNKIYQRIGYERVADSAMTRIGDAPTTHQGGRDGNRKSDTSGKVHTV